MTDPEPQSETYRLDELIAQSRWAHGLALQLVHAAADADDLVQEALIAATANPPRRDRPLRPWLATVLRNGARMLQRSRARRASHEAARGQLQEQELPSAVELVHKAEAQRELVQAVLRLAEPMRETVLLHYFEELTSAEIARRQGLPAGTVRWRLKRGLDQLREDLDARHGGARNWCLMLLPLMQRPGTVLAWSSLTLSAGALVMIKWMTAGSALAGLLWFAGLASGLLGTSEVQLPDETQAREMLGHAPWRADPQDRRSLPITSAKPTAGGSGVLAQLRVVLVDAQGRSLAGVRCRAFLQTESGERLAAPVFSAAAGQLSMALSRPRRSRPAEAAETVVLIFDKPGYARRWQELRVAEGAELDLGRLTLAAGGALHGRVIDPAGRPVADTELWIPAGSGVQLGPERRRALRSDAAGQFRCEGLPVGFCQLRGRKEQLAGESGVVEIRAGQQSKAPLVLVLHPPVAAQGLSGMVLDPAGRPLPGAELRLAYREGQRAGSGSHRCDAQGRFAIDDLPLDGNRLVALDPQQRYAAVARAGLARGSYVVLRLRPLTQLRLELSDPQGRPVPRVAVDVLGVGLPGAAQRSGDAGPGFFLASQAATATENGVLLLPGPGVPYRLRVTAPGFEILETAMHLAVLDPQGQTLPLQLIPAPRIRGRVLAGGRPLAGARVRLHKPARWHLEHNGFPTRLQVAAVAETQSDAEGRFAFTLRGAEALVLRVDARGFAGYESVPRQRGAWPASPLEITLNQGATLHGRLRTADGSSPAGLVVGISRGDGRVLTQRVGADGRYRFERLLPGRYRVKQVAKEVLPGRSSSSSSRRRPVGELPFDCELRVGEERAFDLQVTAAPVILIGSLQLKGRDMRRWQVALLASGAAARQQPDWQTMAADGAFRLSTTSPGPARLMFREIRRAGAQLSLTHNLQPGTNRFRRELAVGEVRGRRAAPSGPRDKIMLRVRGEGFEYRASLPDQSGAFQLLAVPLGQVEIRRSLRATTGDLRSWTLLDRGNLRAGEHLVFDLR